ncbi:MAG: sensor histidine kinase, partial [Actinomycetota bacterium]
TMTTTTMTMTTEQDEHRVTGPPPQSRSGNGGPSLLQRVTGLRGRILGGYVLVLLVAAVASLFVLRTILVNRMDERINSELEQEVAELQRLATRGLDPRTSEPFEGDVRRIFNTFLSRNIPSVNETMLTLIDGEPYRRSIQPEPLPYRVDRDPQLIARWSAVEGSSDFGSAMTPAGELRYLAVPLNNAAGDVEAVFVVADFRDLEKESVDSAVRSAAQITVITLIIGFVLFYALSGRILSRVEAVRSSAQRITESDMTRRLPVEGGDEIAQLAATFNDLLDRLGEAFTTQRSFIDDAGHELRTPITIIRGHLELMGDDPEERRETVSLVTDELDRMTRMVEDLLMLTKARRPDFLNLTAVDVKELTDELNTKVRGLAKREWDLDGSGKGLIEADRQRLTQAMMQLAQNAVQHTAEGDRIWIGSKVSGEEARFWVRDTGPGISKEEQLRIFNRFARARSRARASEGMGLGLAIVKAIAEGHNGRVRLLSAPGQGATFTIIVPVDQPYTDSEELAR